MYNRRLLKRIASPVSHISSNSPIESVVCCVSVNSIFTPEPLSTLLYVKAAPRLFTSGRPLAPGAAIRYTSLCVLTFGCMQEGCTPPHTAGKSFCHIGSVLKFLDFGIPRFRDLRIMRHSKEISKSLHLKIRNYYLYYTILYHCKYKVIFNRPKYSRH